MGQQGAQERHGCRRRLSAEDALRGTALRTRGSYRGTVYGLCGPGACTLSGFRGCQRTPARPVLGSQSSYPPLRSGAPVRVCARVSFTDLLLLPGPGSLGATSKILPDFPLCSWKRTKPRAPCIVSAPPSPHSTPAPPIHCAGFGLGFLAWLQDFLSGGGKGYDQRGEGL